MPSPASHDLTALLRARRDGDARALDAIATRVYEELWRLAHRHMRGERRGHPLQTTALVHEAYLRLIDSSRARSHVLSDATGGERRCDASTGRTRRACRAVPRRLAPQSRIRPQE